MTQTSGRIMRQCHNMLKYNIMKTYKTFSIQFILNLKKFVTEIADRSEYRKVFIPYFTCKLTVHYFLYDIGI
jgi:hypothetical protein